MKNFSKSHSMCAWRACICCWFSKRFPISFQAQFFIKTNSIYKKIILNFILASLFWNKIDSAEIRGALFELVAFLEIVFLGGGLKLCSFLEEFPLFLEAMTKVPIHNRTGILWVFKITQARIDHCTVNGDTGTTPSCIFLSKHYAICVCRWKICVRKR